FENRQVRFGAGQSLRASPARENRTLGTACQFAEKVFDQACLPDARLTGGGQDQAAAFFDTSIRAPELGPLFGAPHRRRVVCYRGRLYIGGAKRPCELALNFARRRPP